LSSILGLLRANGTFVGQGFFAQDATSPRLRRFVTLPVDSAVQLYGSARLPARGSPLAGAW
jgi:hypothetical protein